VGEVVFHQDFPSGEQDDLLVKVYEHLLDSGDWDAERLSELTGAPPGDVKRAQGILVDLRAIEHDPRNGSWRAVSPQLAMAELALPIEVEVRQRARQADKLREQLRMLLPAYESKLRSDPLDAIQVITEGDVLAKLINHEISCCSVEFAVMLSRADPGETDDWYQRTHGQGARIRAVYQHSARTPEPGADYTEVHNLPRGELRTIAELPVDMLLFDGTFWSDDELIRIDSSGATARQMGHIPVGGPDGSLQQLAKLKKPRKIFIHINNTNPMLNESDPEYRAVRDAGWEIAEDGWQFTL